MQEYQQLPHKVVRDDANRLQANWRQAGWNQITHELVLHEMAFVGPLHMLETKVRLWIFSRKDRLDTLDQLCICVASSQFK
jgi:hypothetical protein